MGKTLSTERTKQLFERLDTGRDGEIDLFEFLRGGSESIAGMCSLVTMFHFDVTRDGKLNYNEFREMRDFVSDTRRKVIATSSPQSSRVRRTSTSTHSSSWKTSTSSSSSSLSSSLRSSSSSSSKPTVQDIFLSQDQRGQRGQRGQRQDPSHHRSRRRRRGHHTRHSSADEDHGSSTPTGTPTGTGGDSRFGVTANGTSTTSTRRKRHGRRRADFREHMKTVESNTAAGVAGVGMGMGASASAGTGGGPSSSSGGSGGGSGSISGSGSTSPGSGSGSSSSGSGSAHAHPVAVAVPPSMESLTSPSPSPSPRSPSSTTPASPSPSSRVRRSGRKVSQEKIEVQIPRTLYDTIMKEFGRSGSDVSFVEALERCVVIGRKKRVVGGESRDVDVPLLPLQPETASETASGTATGTAEQKSVSPEGVKTPVASPGAGAGGAGSKSTLLTGGNLSLRGVSRRPKRSQMVSMTFGRDFSETSSGSDGELFPDVPSSDSEDDEAARIKQHVSKRLSQTKPTSPFSTQRGRNEFLEWLFRLADFTDDGKIDPSDLGVILHAVQNDGIDLYFLLFSDDARRSMDVAHEQGDTQLVVNAFMREYDLDEDGLLTKGEFFRLAEMILVFYQLKEALGFEQTLIGDWRLEHVLGKGSFGIVHYALNLNTYETRAIKVVPKGNCAEMSQLDVEITAMKVLDHPNVVKLFEVSEDDQKIYMHLTLCGGGSLYEYLSDNRPFSEPVARFYFRQLVDGLQYCHEQGVTHRDLRLENLLLENGSNLRISDFGQARIFKKGWDLFSTQITSSLYHVSPEQLAGNVYSAKKLDIWGCGIILFCFLTAQLPFRSPDMQLMFAQIRAGEYSWPPNRLVSDEAKDLVAGMLATDPEKRLTIEQLSAHPWLSLPVEVPNLVTRKKKLYGVPCSSFLQKRSFLRILRRVMREHEVHCIMRMKNLTTKAVLRCIQPRLYMKFVLTVKFRRNDRCRLNFNCTEGESLRFGRIVNRICEHLERVVCNVKTRLNGKPSRSRSRRGEL